MHASDANDISIRQLSLQSGRVRVRVLSMTILQLQIAHEISCHTLKACGNSTTSNSHRIHTVVWDNNYTRCHWKQQVSGSFESRQ